MKNDMKNWVDKFRDEKAAQGLLGRIGELAGELGRTVRLMEVCGTHTVAIYRYGMREVLGEKVELL